MKVPSRRPYCLDNLRSGRQAVPTSFRRRQASRWSIFGAAALALSSPASGQNIQGLIAGFVGAAIVAGTQSAWNALPHNDLNCIQQALLQAGMSEWQVIQRG